jgi:predicted nucleic acid-binding protein
MARPAHLDSTPPIDIVDDGLTDEQIAERVSMIWKRRQPWSCRYRRQKNSLRHDATAWVPDGLFDVEVLAVLRRWDLHAVLSESQVESSRMRLANLRLRRSTVASLASRAWQLRANITFPDACYVALTEALHCPLLTADQRLVAAPTLPVSTLHLWRRTSPPATRH